jgi:hypothetical protein
MNVVPLKQLSIEYIKDFVQQKTCFCIHNPNGDLFQHPETKDGIPENCLLIDLQNANVICIVYNALNDKNKANFNRILQNEYKFASLLDEMWSFVR